MIFDYGRVSWGEYSWLLRRISNGTVRLFIHRHISLIYRKDFPDLLSGWKEFKRITKGDK